MTKKPAKGVPAEYLKFGECKLCAESAKLSSTIQVIGAPGRGAAHRSRRGMPDGKRVPQTGFACKICKVRLCRKGCFTLWNHDDNCAPCQRVLCL